MILKDILALIPNTNTIFIEVPSGRDYWGVAAGTKDDPDFQKKVKDLLTREVVKVSAPAIRNSLMIHLA